MKKDKMEEQKRNAIQDLSLEFSIQLMNYESNILSKKSIIHSNQLIRSGTAIGAMVREAQPNQQQHTSTSAHY